MNSFIEEGWFFKNGTPANVSRCVHHIWGSLTTLSYNLYKPFETELMSPKRATEAFIRFFYQKQTGREQFPVSYMLTMCPQPNAMSLGLVKQTGKPKCKIKQNFQIIQFKARIKTKIASNCAFKNKTLIDHVRWSCEHTATELEISTCDSLSELIPPGEFSVDWKVVESGNLDRTASCWIVGKGGLRGTMFGTLPTRRL